MAIKKYPQCHRLGKDGQPNYTIRDFVKDMIEPLTDGARMGYALLQNKEKPLKAKVSVSVSTLSKPSAWFKYFLILSAFHY